MPNSVKLQYSEQGQGTPVVLLHGFPLSRAIWADQQRSLSEHYRVIAPDLRGHGESPVPPGDYEMDLLAGDVLALLDRLGVEKAVLMGHSMGGYVTLAAWKLAPERFLGLGLICSQAGADTEEARQNRYKTADRVAAEGSKVVVAAMLPKLFAPGVPADVPIAEQVRKLILATQPAGIVGALKGMAARPDSLPRLPDVRLPVLVLAGGKDQIIPLEKAQAMVERLPNGKLHVLDNAGHMPMLEQAQELSTAILDFLRNAGL